MTDKTVFKSGWTYLLAIIFLLIVKTEPITGGEFIWAFIFYILFSAIIIKIIKWIIKKIKGVK